MFEHLIKRTIWVAKCEGCGASDEQTDRHPRERFCADCQKWVPYVEQSYIGPDLAARKNA